MTARQSVSAFRTAARQLPSEGMSQRSDTKGGLRAQCGDHPQRHNEFHLPLYGGRGWLVTFLIVGITPNAKDHRFPGGCTPPAELRGR